MYCLIPRPDQWFMNFVYCHEKYAMLMSLFVSDGKHLFALFERLRNFNKFTYKEQFSVHDFLDYNYHSILLCQSANQTKC